MTQLQTNSTQPSLMPSQATIDYSQYKILRDKIVSGEDISFDDSIAAIDVITDMQRGIEKIAEIAETKIARKMRQLNYFHRLWYNTLDAFKSRLKAGGHSLRLDTGTLKWESSGGWVVDDREKVKDYLAQKPVEELTEYGAEWTLSFNVDKIVNVVKTTGEVIPGIIWLEPNPHAKLRIGVTKPWSTRNIKIALGKALDTIEDEEEEA